MGAEHGHPALGRVVLLVAGLNLAWFGVQFVVAGLIGSVALYADSIDFLEDASVNLLIWLALGWSAPNRARLGFLLAGVLLVPTGVTLWTLWQELLAPSVPAAVPMSATAVGALVVNSLCALLLVGHRETGGSLARAAFLSARNDVLVNLVILTAGGVTAATHSAWPDLLVGLFIAAINLGAAREVVEAAREEARSPARS